MRLAYFFSVSFHYLSVCATKKKKKKEETSIQHRGQCHNTVFCMSVCIRVQPSDVRWEDRGNKAIWEQLEMGRQKHCQSAQLAASFLTNKSLLQSAQPHLYIEQASINQYFLSALHHINPTEKNLQELVKWKVKSRTLGHRPPL